MLRKIVVGMLNEFVWFRIIAGGSHGRRLATFTPKVVQADWAGFLAECNSSIAPSVQYCYFLTGRTLNVSVDRSGLSIGLLAVYNRHEKRVIT